MASYTSNLAFDDGPDDRALMQAISLLAEGQTRNELAALLGDRRTFAGRRRIMKVLGYEENPDFESYWKRYRRQDVARRIIDLPVNATWGGGALEVDGFAGRGETWETFERRLNVTERLSCTDRLAGIGRYAVLVFGLAEAEDPRANPAFMKQPVDRLSSLGDVLNLRYFGENKVDITEVEDRPSDPRFGKPKLYKIDMSIRTSTQFGQQGIIGQQREVHWTRVLHVPSVTTLDDIAGPPRLENVLDRLHDLEKVVGGSAEMFWQGADRFPVITKNSGGAWKKSETDEMDERMEKIAHGLRRWMGLSGASIETLPSVQPDPTGIAKICMTLIAAAEDIPMRILFGSERGELASTQDRNNFADTIIARRSNYAQPTLVEQLTDRLHFWGIANDPSEQLPIWPPIDFLSALEEAELAAKKMEALKAAEEAFAAGGAIASAEEIRALIGLRGPRPEDAVRGDGGDVLDEADEAVMDEFERARAA